MDAANLQALGEYTAGAAHKINNLLSVISGNAQYLLARVKEKDLGSLTEEDIREIRNSLNIITEKGDCLGAIAKKLLELTAEAKSR
jgi:signal transduction histidine kinase